MTRIMQLLRRVRHRRLHHHFERDPRIPLVCPGYLPLAIQRQLTIRDFRRTL